MPRASSETVMNELLKSMHLGGLARLPRNPERQAIVLAVLCLGLQRRVPYSEVEMNDYLKERLRGLHSSVDHVTCRRYLVDRGFVKRNRSGSRYLLNYPRVESVLSDNAIADADALVELARDAQRRKSRRR